jgi:hypothetical protein
VLQLAAYQTMPIASVGCPDLDSLVRWIETAKLTWLQQEHLCWGAGHRSLAGCSVDETCTDMSLDGAKATTLSYML